MKSLNKTETPIFLSVVCSLFRKAIFLTFIDIGLIQAAVFAFGLFFLGTIDVSSSKPGKLSSSP